MNLRILFALAWAIFNLACVCSTRAAEEPVAIVKSIDVQIVGPKSVSKEKVLGKLQTKVGKAYSIELAESDISVLSEEENIVNVRIFGEPVKDGLKVRVVVQTKAAASKSKP